MITNPINRSVGAYQILVSVNPFIKKDLANRIHTSTDLISSYRGERFSTLFSSETDNFIELKHNFKYKDASDSKGPLLIIKTFDPGLKFFNDLFFNFTSKSLSLIADAKVEEITTMKNYFKDLEELKPKAAYLAARYEDELGSGSYHRLPEFEDYDPDKVYNIRDLEYVDRSGEEQRRLKKELSDIDKDISEREEFLVTQMSERTMPKVYVMYGIGTDLNHWAGPIECYLGDLKYKNDGKEEIVEYHFAIDLLTMQYADSSIGIPKEDSTRFRNIGIPVQRYERFNGLSDDSVFEPKGFKNKSFSFHDVIVKLISNYLFQIGIKDNLVVLPNLDSVLSAAINNAVIRAFQNPAIAEVLDEAGPPYSSNLLLDFDTPYGHGSGALVREKTISSIVTSLFSGSTIEDELAAEGSFGFLLREDSPPIELGLLLQANEDIIVDVFEQIGLKVSRPSALSSESIDPALVMFEPRVRIGFPIIGGSIGFSDQVSCANPFDIIGTTYGHPAEVKGERLLRVNFDHKTVWEEGVNTRDWAKPITDLIDGINAATKDTPINYSGNFCAETSLATPIEKKFGGGTYLGYVNGGRIAPKLTNKPTFICGDRDLIRLLVFGEISQQVLNEGALTFGDQYWLSHIGDFPIWNLSEEGRAKGGFKDPFWLALTDDIKYVTDNAVAWGTYFDEIYAVFNPNIQGNGSVNLGYFTGIAESPGELVDYFPDEFGLNKGTLGAESLNNIFRLNMPVFLANTHNANVLSYSFDADKFLLATLIRNIEEIYQNVARRYGTVGEIVEGDMSKDDIFIEIMKTLDKMKAKIGYSGKGLTVTTGVGEPVDAEEIYDNLATLIYLESVSPGGVTTRIRKRRQSSILGFLMLFLDAFSRQYIGTLKTLPMFHISTYADLLRSCVAIIKSTRKAIPNPADRTQQDVADFFSGPNTLLGFSHVIRKESAYSEFTIQKDMLMELTNE